MKKRQREIRGRYSLSLIWSFEWISISITDSLE